MRSAAAWVVAVPADGDLGADAVALLARLARHLVGAGAEVDGEVAAGAGTDVLDLAHHLVALAVDVDLGDVAALVGDGEGGRAARARSVLATSHDESVAVTAMLFSPLSFDGQPARAARRTTPPRARAGTLEFM